MNKYPPCNGDCFNCTRPAKKCHGGQERNRKTAYVKGTGPKSTSGKGDFGAVRLVGEKIWQNG